MVMSGIIIWKSINRKDGYYDKGEIPNCTLEQSAFAGIGHSRSDLCSCRLFHFALVDKGWVDRASDYRGALLNSHRVPYSHAVRLASEKLG